MLDDELKKLHEDCIKDMIEDIAQMEEGEKKTQAIANVVKMMGQLNDFYKTQNERDLKEIELRVREQVELKKIELEQASKEPTETERKRAAREKIIDRFLEFLKLAAPLGVWTGFMLKGFKFEERDLIATSPTVKMAWQGLGKPKI